MGAETGIQWTDHTFNPWWGCQRVSPGCENCYAEVWDKHRGGGEPHWGPKAPRRFFGDKHWNEPLKWNREAEAAGRRARVFCASMADVFEDREDLIAQRERLFRLIESTPHLDWQLLTKRPENFRRFLPAPWLEKPRFNVWLGTTIEDQLRAEARIGWLLDAPAVVRFVSAEPLLGPVNLRDIEVIAAVAPHGPRVSIDALTGHVKGPDDMLEERVHWVIVGGESGPGARSMRLEWARDLVNQCTDAGVAVFSKQLGAWPSLAEEIWRAEANEGRTRLLNHRGGEHAPNGCVVLKLPDKKGGGETASWPGGAEAWPRSFPANPAAEVRR